MFGVGDGLGVKVGIAVLVGAEDGVKVTVAVGVAAGLTAAQAGNATNNMIMIGIIGIGQLYFTPSSFGGLCRIASLYKYYDFFHYFSIDICNQFENLLLSFLHGHGDHEDAPPAWFRPLGNTGLKSDMSRAFIHFSEYCACA